MREIIRFPKKSPLQQNVIKPDLNIFINLFKTIISIASKRRKPRVYPRNTSYNGEYY